MAASGVSDWDRPSRARFCCDILLRYYQYSRLALTPHKRLLPVALALFLVGLAILLVPPTQPLVPSVRGSSKTFTLIGFVSGWNSSQPSGSNPPITVTQGDTVTMRLSSGDGAPHRFLVDLDRDPMTPPDTYDCPTTDPCSSTFSTGSVTTYTFTISAGTTPGNYQYICTIHYPAMVGNFVLQAPPPTPDFTIASTPSSLTFLQGSSGTSTITLTSVSGFSGTVMLAASISPSGPTPSLSPMSVTISSGTSAPSTLTVSTSSSTPSGTYSVNVNGTSGSTAHTTTVTVQVNAPAGQDFSITSNPASLNVTQGSSSSSTITLTSVNGFSGILSLTETISPSGGPSVTFSPMSVSLAASNSVTSTVTASAVAGAYSPVATGTYSLNITATNGSLSHSKVVAVTVSSTASPPSGTGGLPVIVLVGAAVVIIAAVGVVVYLVRRKPAAT